MRNVLFAGEDKISVRSARPGAPVCKDPAAIAADSLSQTVFVLARNGTLVASRASDTNALWSLQLSKVSAGGQTLSWEHISFWTDAQAVLCATRCGTIVTVDCQSLEIEEVGQIEGVSSAEHGTLPIFR